MKYLTFLDIIFLKLIWFLICLIFKNILLVKIEIIKFINNYKVY